MPEIPSITMPDVPAAPSAGDRPLADGGLPSHAFPLVFYAVAALAAGPTFGFVFDHVLRAVAVARGNEFRAAGGWAATHGNFLVARSGCLLGDMQMYER